MLLCPRPRFQVSAGRGRQQQPWRHWSCQGRLDCSPWALTEGQRLCHPTALVADGGRSGMSPRDSHCVLTAPSQPQPLLQVKGHPSPQAEHSTP